MCLRLQRPRPLRLRPPTVQMAVVLPSGQPALVSQQQYLMIQQQARRGIGRVDCLGGGRAVGAYCPGPCRPPPDPTPHLRSPRLPPPRAGSRGAAAAAAGGRRHHACGRTGGIGAADGGAAGAGGAAGGSVWRRGRRRRWWRWHDGAAARSQAAAAEGRVMWTCGLRCICEDSEQLAFVHRTDVSDQCRAGGCMPSLPGVGGYPPLRCRPWSQ